MPIPTVTERPPTVQNTAETLYESISTPQGVAIIAAVLFLVCYEYFKPEPKGKGARFASDRELRRARKLAIRQLKQRHTKPTEVGVIIDNDNHEAHTHLETSEIYIGAVKVGKTYFGINPTVKALFDRGDTVILYDYKYPGQTKNLIGYAESVGYAKEDIQVFAPSFEESCIFNPVEAATANYCETLSNTLVKNFSKEGDKDPFFGRAGVALTAAVLSLARDLGGDISTCQAILSRKDLPARIRGAQERMDPWTYAQFAQFLSVADSEKTAASIAGTAALNFQRFLNPSIASAFMGQSNIPLHLEGKKLVILGSNYLYRDSTLPIIAVVLQTLIDNNVFHGRKTPLAIVADEFPTIFLPSIVEQIAAVREYGIFFLIGLQNLSQLALTYGQDKVKPIIGCCRTKIIFNPNELESAKYFSEMVGTRQVIEREVSKTTGSGKTTRNRSRKKEWRPLITPEEIMNFPTGKRIIFSEAVGSQATAFRPYLSTAKPNTACQKAFKDSREKWPEIRDALAARTKQIPVNPAKLTHEINKVDALLPAPGDIQEDDSSVDEEFQAFANEIFR